MPKFELTENQVNNNLNLLNRVKTEGFTEAQVLLELQYIFTHPVQDLALVEKEKK